MSKFVGDRTNVPLGRFELSERRHLNEIPGWRIEGLITAVFDDGRKTREKSIGVFYAHRFRQLVRDPRSIAVHLACIEDVIAKEVLPYYGNTHTSATHTSSVSTSYRCEMLADIYSYFETLLMQETPVYYMQKRGEADSKRSCWCWQR